LVDVALPLKLGPIDHYTLIVEDAAAVAKFHTDFLGFEPLRIQLVNAGSAPPGEHDMLNHVLQIPGTSRRVLVVTEGLTETSIFRRYLRAHGPGVHHVAYEVPDLDAALKTLRQEGIKTTSPEVLRDPLTGLRQIFLSREHGGYFIELIERTNQAASGNFTNDNMAGLARTMLSYLKDTSAPVPGSRALPPSPRVTIQAPREAVVAFLLDPFNLPRWTGHRAIRRIDGVVVEVRLAGDLPVTIREQDEAVLFRWSRGEQALEFALRVSSTEHAATTVSAALPPLEGARLEHTARVIQTELELLGALLENRAHTFSAEGRALIDAYHLEVHQRAGL
jgi:methylmalonyl-CoA/ethylmalonyl-CoA epimerase